MGKICSIKEEHSSAETGTIMYKRLTEVRQQSSILLCRMTVERNFAVTFPKLNDWIKNSRANVLN